MQPMKLEVIKQDNSTNDLAISKLDGKLSLETVSHFLQSMRQEMDGKQDQGLTLQRPRQGNMKQVLRFRRAPSLVHFLEENDS
jgi:hypothetical protein